MNRLAFALTLIACSPIVVAGLALLVGAVAALGLAFVILEVTGLRRG